MSKAHLDQSPKGKPIRLGAIYNLQGAQAGLDIPSADGAVLASLEINRSGGIRGRPLQLLLRDGMTEIDRIRDQVHALVSEDRVSMVLGLSDTDMAFAAGLEAARAGVPFLSSGATSPLLSTQIPNLLFLSCFGDNVQAAAAAEFAFRNPLYETAALMVQSDMEFAIVLARYFRAAFTNLGGHIIGEMPFRTDPENLEIGVKILSDLHPSPAFIFLACGPEQAGIIIRRLREGGLKMPIIGGDSFDTPGLIPQAGELADNIFFTSHAFLNASNPSPLVKYFINSFQSEYHRMPENAFAALGYDAVNLAARALRQSGSAEPAAVRDAMAGTIGFQGVTGELSYHNSNHVPIKRVSIVNIKNGNLSLADTVLPRQIPDP